MNKMSALLIGGILVCFMTGCGGNQGLPTATISVADVQTLAVLTYETSLTQTAQALPVPTDTLPAAAPVANGGAAPLSTFAPLNGTNTPTLPGITATASCNGLGYIKDVTVPDHTQMVAGKTFTKTWMVQNLGSCAWQPGFKFTLIGGNPMGGSTKTLTQAVTPGTQTELSINMIAPSAPGDVVGTWRMEDTNGTFFGDYLTVVITVTSGPTETPTLGAATATHTPTSTPTP